MKDCDKVKWLIYMVSLRRFVIAFLVITVVACSDDEVTPTESNEAFVTRISEDGVTDLELYYDINKNLYRVNYYSGGTLSSYTIYDYDTKGIKESRRYNADDHSLDYRTVFNLDNFGRVIKGENYSSPDFDAVGSLSEFGYNTSGQLITREFRSAGQPVYYRDEFAYDDQGNLVTQQRTTYPGQTGEYKSALYEYTPGGTSIPEHWQMPIFLLGVSGLDERIRYMFNTNIVVNLWNADQELYIDLSYAISGHEFGGDGNLTRLVMTRKNLLSPENPDIVWEMSYEYVE